MRNKNKKISDALKGIKRGPFTEEHRKKLSKQKSQQMRDRLSAAKQGKPSGHKHSEMTKIKMSEWQKGVPKPLVECKECGKKMTSVQNLARWHGDRCKK